MPRAKSAKPPTRPSRSKPGGKSRAANRPVGKQNRPKPSRKLAVKPPVKPAPKPRKPAAKRPPKVIEEDVASAADPAAAILHKGRRQGYVDYNDIIKAIPETEDNMDILDQLHADLLEAG